MEFNLWVEDDDDVVEMCEAYEDRGVEGEVDEAEDAEEDEEEPEDVEEDDDDDDDEEDTEQLAEVDEPTLLAEAEVVSMLELPIEAPDLAKFGESSLIGGVGMPCTSD